MKGANAPQEWQNVPAGNIRRFQKFVRYKRADNKENKGMCADWSIHDKGDVKGYIVVDDEKEYMKLYFNDTEISVIWEDNQTVLIDNYRIIPVYLIHKADRNS